jgi:hypothetical protein
MTVRPTALERRPEIEVLVEVALVQVHVTHDHHVGRVADDPARPLDLAPLPQVLGRRRVAERMGVNPEADLVPDGWKSSVTVSTRTGLPSGRGSAGSEPLAQLPHLGESQRGGLDREELEAYLKELTAEVSQSPERRLWHRIKGFGRAIGSLATVAPKFLDAWNNTWPMIENLRGQ